jgi:alanine racemase
LLYSKNVENNHLYATWVEIDLNAIENNLHLIKRRCKTGVMAIVKANAYGHGATNVAQAALNAGADWLGVARVDEALALRQPFPDTPILILGYTPPGQLEDVIQNDITLTIWKSSQVVDMAKAARKIGKPAYVHLKVDTGMSRIGVHPTDAAQLAHTIYANEAIILQGLFTHYARADEPALTTTDEQENLFSSTIQQIKSVVPSPLILHTDNSAASLTRSTGGRHLVRLGIAMYGLHPSPDVPLPSDFRPALTWKTVLSEVKMLPAGQGVSYGHEYITHQDELIGTLPLGYADGFRRVKGNQVLINGVKVPVVGRVCMDQSMVSLDRVPGAQIGDEVVVIGHQGTSQISAEEVAQRWLTINYEVVCDIGPRVPRLMSP